MLFSTKEKAAAIAEHHSTDFRKNVDGMIQQFWNIQMSDNKKILSNM